MLLWIAGAHSHGLGGPMCHMCGNTEDLTICVHCVKPVCPGCRWGYGEADVHCCDACDCTNGQVDKAIRKQLEVGGYTSRALAGLGVVCIVIAVVISALLAAGVLK